MNKYPNIQIMSNGDLFQLEPVNEVLTDAKRSELINYMFPNHIVLHISKRFELDSRFKEIQ